MNDWLRYPRILAICWRAGVSGEMEYRLNFLSSAALSGFWMLWAVAGVAVYFQFTGDIAGWGYGEVLVVVGLFFAVNGIRQMLFDPNLQRMGEYVRRGTLDFLLTKPVDAQLLVSLRHLNVQNLTDPVLGLILVVAGVLVTGRGVSAAGLASFVLLLAAAVTLLYAMTVVLLAVAVRVMAAEELGEVSFTVTELARFPVQLYRQPVQTVLTVVPVAFLTTVPAQALLDRLDPWMLLVGPAVAAGALVVATLTWRRSLRSYTGASA